jgi:hypothetical protein
MHVNVISLTRSAANSPQTEREHSGVTDTAHTPSQLLPRTAARHVTSLSQRMRSCSQLPSRSHGGSSWSAGLGIMHAIRIQMMCVVSLQCQSGAVGVYTSARGERRAPDISLVAPR